MNFSIRLEDLKIVQKILKSSETLMQISIRYALLHKGLRSTIASPKGQPFLELPYFLDHSGWLTPKPTPNPDFETQLNWLPPIKVSQ